MNRPEQELQKSVVEYLELAKPRCIWFHVPNGGARSKTEAAIMKGLGVKAGVADLIFLWKDRCSFIELKTEKGRISKAQVAFMEECGEYGIGYVTCHSLEEVFFWLKTWDIPLENDVRLA